MKTCRGESTEGEPEESRWSTIEHHPVSKGVVMSRAKWVEVLESSLPEGMHLQLRVDARFIGERVYTVSKTGGDVGSAADRATPSRRDA